MAGQTTTPKAAARTLRARGGYTRIDHSTLFGGYVTATRHGVELEIERDGDTWTGDERMLRDAGIVTAPRCRCHLASSSVSLTCQVHGRTGYRFGRPT